MRYETIQYVRVLETSYNEKIKSLQMQMEKLRKHAQSDRVKHIGKDVEKRDLEHLFVDCVEEVRKDIARRRLKNELNSRRRTALVRTHEEELHFELSLEKLADFAKGRVKYEEFNAIDRNNVLDLFVNNPQVLLAINAQIFN